MVRRLQRWVRREPGLVCRLIGLTLAIVIEHGYYLTAATTPVDHWTVMSTMAIWVAVSWVCQIVLNRGTAPAVIPFVWAGADAVLFTILVMLAAEPRELLIVGYPLLIVAAGFWVRVRLVSFMTVFCLASYALVYFFGSDTVWPRHYPFLIGGIIALVGGFVGYQVHRLRVLSRYFDRGR
ncbi:MAG: hypothetical protein R3B90_04340 [Planctomycetaceae bacterium]